MPCQISKSDLSQLLKNDERQSCRRQESRSNSASTSFSIIRSRAQKTMNLPSRIIFLLARLVPNLLGVVTAAVLTRLLEPAEYGLYALGLSIIFFLTIGVFEWLGLSML